MQVSSKSRVASPVSNVIDVLFEELMLTAREIIANPAVAVDCRDKYGLLADLGADASEEIAAYYPIFPIWLSF